MVKELRIAGFKCFKDIKLELNNLTLFTGVNSAGKSSAIQAILLLLQQRQSENGLLNGKYIKLGRFQEVRNTIINARKIDIGMTVKNADDEFECSIAINSEEKITKNNFEKIKEILGFDIDHSFLTYKKELKEYGYEVCKISMKEKIVTIKMLPRD